MQVVGAVGWGNAQLSLTDDMQPTLKSLIASCWTQPQDRPSFGDIIAILKPMVQNNPAPPPPPMANAELVNVQWVQPMRSPMLAAASASPSQQNLDAVVGQAVTERAKSHALQGPGLLAPQNSHDQADAAGDKFAAVVRKVMDIATNAKSAVDQHVGATESPRM